MTPVKGILKSRTVLQGGNEFLIAFNEPAIENSWYVLYVYCLFPHRTNIILIPVIFACVVRQSIAPHPAAATNSAHESAIVGAFTHVQEATKDVQHFDVNKHQLITSRADRLV